MTQCGRPTVSGRPCRNGRVGPPAMWRIRALLGQPAPAIEIPRSCRQHMTEQEAAAVDGIYEDDRAETERLTDAERRPPACWDWPVTDTHLEQSARVREIGDLGDAYVAATRLLRHWQAGRCAVCGGPESAEVLDHDHVTGLMRGRLCQSCNLLEGFASDPEDPCVLYRTRNPATILGVKMLYHSPFTGWAEPEPDRPPEHDRSPGYALADYLAGDD